MIVGGTDAAALLCCMEPRMAAALAQQVFVCATYHSQHCALRKLSPANTHRWNGRNFFRLNVFCRIIDRLLPVLFAQPITGRQHCARRRIDVHWTCREPCREARVQRTLNSSTAFVEYVGVDHCRLDAGVSEQFLDGPDVVTRFQEMCGERMSECVAGRAFGDPGTTNCRSDFTRYGGLVQVVPAEQSGTRIA